MVPRSKSEKVINFLDRRGLFFGAAFYPTIGTQLYVFTGAKIRLMPLGTAMAFVQAIKRKERNREWQSFGLTRA